MQRFYLNTTLQTGMELILPTDVTRHVQVLRLQPGDTIELFDGSGNSYTANICSITRKAVQVVVGSLYNQQNASPKPIINLLLCIIANDKMDMAIQKAVELGVSTITPVVSRYAQKLASDKIATKLGHWQQIIINSCCQCGNNLLPTLTAPITLNEVFSNPLTRDHLKFMLTQLSSNNSVLPEKNGSSTHIELLVGPEGGFSHDELLAAQRHGFIQVKLGNCDNNIPSLILRSETAVIAGLTWVNIQYGNWSK